MPSDNPEYLLGIDPGLRGALACIRAAPPHDLVFFHRFDPPPHIPARDIPGFFLASVPNPLPHTLVIFEDATAFPGQSIASAARLSLARASLQTIFTPVICVRPAQWKRKLGLNSDKSRSIRLARPFFPPNLRISHDLAEAVLIAFSHTIPYSRPQAFQ